MKTVDAFTSRILLNDLDLSLNIIFWWPTSVSVFHPQAKDAFVDFIEGSGKSTVVNSLIDVARKKKMFDCDSAKGANKAKVQVNYRHATVQEV